MNPFWMVLADLRKTFLSSLGILVLLALAFSATVAVSLLDRSLRQAGAQSARDIDLVVGAPGSRLDLVLASVFLRTDEVLPLVPYSVVEKLSSDPRVAALSPLVFADSYNGSPIVGIGASFPSLRPTLRLTAGLWPQEEMEVVAGAATGLRVGDHFEGTHGTGEALDEEAHHHGEFTVVGVLGSSGTPWDRSFLTPAEGIWELHGHEAHHEEGAEHAMEGEVSAILVKPKDFASAYALRAEYREGPTTAAFPGEVLSGIFGLFDDVKKALSLFSLVFQLLVFAAVLLSLLAALPTQAKWIGLLRALGAGPVYIFLTLWIQAAVIFTAAGVAGAGFGWLGAQSLATFVSARSGLVLAVGWSWDESGLLGLYWLSGLVGALVPAWVGYRTPVRRAVLGQ